MIVPETLEQIASAAVSLGDLNDQTLGSLKQSWPDLRFTLCNDDDMPAVCRPHCGGDVNLYLVNGSEPASA
jgi:hypothetical protein